MKIAFLRMVQGCVCAVLLGTSFAYGQSVTGSIAGTVTDPSGAVVAGATVTAHNQDTNVDTPATTNSTGNYHIDFLQIGKYDVRVSAPGFSSTKLPVFSLE